MSFYDRQLQGMISYRVGHLAEDAVARLYQGLGYRLEARCWRGVCGEIDLVFRHGGGWVFVEVKSSKTWAQSHNETLLYFDVRFSRMCFQICFDKLLRSSTSCVHRLFASKS